MKIGIIGYGNMGSAVADCVKLEYPVVVFDKDSVKLGKVSGMDVAKSDADLAQQADVIILAVKPQDFGDLLSGIEKFVAGKLVISIAAGITTQHIENVLKSARVIRSMPNLPAQKRAGMICLCKGRSAVEQDLRFAQDLFLFLGHVQILDSEDMMHAATAVSGSGPGFFFNAVEGKSSVEIKEYADKHFFFKLTAAAEDAGFSHDQAVILAKTTTDGSVIFLKETGMNPEDAKKLVASKKGTTEAGLEVLDKGGSLTEAVLAAVQRSKQLSQG